MGNDIVVQLDGVSKKFCRSLKRSMWYGFRDVLRDTIGLHPRSEKLRPQEFWAVDDVSFELKRGECLGLIGPNGAGKSTILKMLNGIVRPDRGSIRIRGRVGALIQVGAGFHPQLTGRENIYVNAAILGMSMKETSAKFDEIVEFADIGDFLDTPVKFYSSGMYVRLGFSIAVSTAPDVLLVDEILAVGDYAFQIKCVNRIKSLITQGTAVLLVSHNESLVTRTATKALLLNDGCAEFAGSIAECYDKYHSLMQDIMSMRAGNGKVEITGITMFDELGHVTDVIDRGAPFRIRVMLRPKAKVDDFALEIIFVAADGTTLVSSHSEEGSPGLGSLDDPMVVDAFFPKPCLAKGIYLITVSCSSRDFMEIYDVRRRHWRLQISGEPSLQGYAYMKSKWETLAKPEGMTHSAPLRPSYYDRVE